MNKYKLRNYQIEAVNAGMDYLRNKDKGGGIIVAPTACLSGDTIIQINNRKNSKKYKLRDAYLCYNKLKKNPNYNWKFSDDIFTRSMLNGRIGLNKVKNITYSGKRKTIKLKFNIGEELILTPEHKLFTGSSWIMAENALNRKIAFDITPKAIKNVKKYVKYNDNFVNLGRFHPYARKTIDKRNGLFSYRVEEHRAVYEAFINGYDIETYKKIAKETPILMKKMFRAINPKHYDIHHIDFDHKNNNPKNLIHLKRSEHKKLHAEEGKKNFGQGKIGFTECISIEDGEVIDTYDIHCEAPYHNFMANRIVVHNSGKSLIIASIAEQLEGNTLVLQPSLEILLQNVSKAKDLGINDIQIYSASAGQKNIGGCTFATIGSIIKKKELFDNFQHLIIDECHAVNAKGGMYEELINYMGGKVLGLTATPYRLHAYSDFRTGRLSVVAKFLHRTRPRLFSKIIHITQIQELYEKGFLCKINYLENSDYNHSEIELNSTGMDFNEESLSEYNKSHNIVEIATRIVQEDNSEHILVFMSSVDEATLLAQNIASKGISSAIVSAKTSKKDREEILRQFKLGRIRVVTNVSCLTTGYDFPELDCVILCRPTQSVALYYQMMGRGIRIAYGKREVKVVDLCGNVKRFGKIEEFKIVEEKPNLHRLKSNSSFLTGYCFYNNEDLEATDYAGLKETKFANRDQIVPFGKHKGEHVTKLPTGYLDWGEKTFNGKIQKMFAKELKRREDSRKEKVDKLEKIPF